MKVNDNGYTITGVPGLEYITVRCSSGSEHGVEIVTKDDIELGGPRSWGLDEAQELFEAMQRAVALGWSMANANRSAELDS